VFPGDRAGVEVPTEQDLSLQTSCTFTADDIEALLSAANSPAAGKNAGLTAEAACQATGIDNAYWFYMFTYESNLGADPNWAGWKPNGDTTANTGNIICAGYPTCYGRFRDYQGNWDEGITQQFQLLRCYRDGGGPGCEGLWVGEAHPTLESAINTWAPPTENDTSAYYQFVRDSTQEARRVKQGVAVQDGSPGQTTLTTEGNPLPKQQTEVRLALAGGAETNVISAYRSSPGLREFTIAPGETWSFNEQWKVDPPSLVEAGGVFGGGVCSYAAALAEASYDLGLMVDSYPHGKTYEPTLRPSSQVAIWSSGAAGGQDLIIHGHPTKTTHFRVTLRPGDLTIQAETT
jgi:hypothetical protein